jgi:pilus assembly protein Flp/PilA
MTGARRSGKRRVASPTDESGATAVEYALLASLIAAAIGVTVGALGQQVLALFESVSIPFG